MLLGLDAPFKITSSCWAENENRQGQLRHSLNLLPLGQRLAPIISLTLIMDFVTRTLVDNQAHKARMEYFVRTSL